MTQIENLCGSLMSYLHHFAKYIWEESLRERKKGADSYTCLCKGNI